MVPGPLGQATLVARDGGCIQHDLGQRVSLGKTRGRMGARPSSSSAHSPLQASLRGYAAGRPVALRESERRRLMAIFALTEYARELAGIEPRRKPAALLRFCRRGMAIVD